MTREEVNQTLNELCEYGGMMLGSRYVEAIRIAAIFYETGKDTATKEEKKCTDCKWYGFTCECPVHCTQDTKVAWEKAKGESEC